MEQLSNAEVLDLMTLQKWGSYFGEIPLFYPETSKPVESFSMETLPEVDVLVVVGSPRLVEYAGVFIMKTRQLERADPELVLLGQERAYPLQISSARLMSQLLVDVGFDETYVRKNLQSLASVQGNVVAELEYVMRRVLPQKRRIALIADSGASLGLIHKLVWKMRNVEFFVFETPLFYVRYIETLLHPSGDSSEALSLLQSRVEQQIDTLVANIAECICDKDFMKLLEVSGRLPLASGKSLLELLLPYVRKGYVGKINSVEQWRCLGISQEEQIALQNKRQAELDCVSCSENAYLYVLSQMLSSILEKWFAMDQFPY